MAKHPAVGEQAPDFTLEGTSGTFTLSDHRGERVLLLFYPGDETTVCTKQFCSYAERADDMSALDATVVGISAQDIDSHSKFVTENGVDAKKFSEVYKSFAVQTKVRQAKQLSDAYKIDGVPAIGVQGRYYTSVALAGGPERALAVVDHLVQRVRTAG